MKDVLLGGALQAKQLQLKEGQAWKLFLDIYVLDADGCIFDVCLLAAVAALLALKLPSAEIDEEGKVSVPPPTGALEGVHSKWVVMQGLDCQHILPIACSGSVAPLVTQ